MLKKFKSTIARSAMVAACAMFATVAVATPPTRPVAIDHALEKDAPALQLENGAFRLPLRIIANQAEDAVVVTTTVFSTDPLRPQALSTATDRFSAAEKDSVFIARIPAMKAPGVYKVEIAAGDAKGAVYDRAVFFQEVGADGSARLYTQAQWREVKKSRRSDNFREQKSVGALAGSMRAVKAEDLRGLKVAPGDDKALIVRPDANIGDDAAFVRDVSQEAWRSQDPVTFRGRIVFTDFDGTVRPLVNGGIFLYDDDWNGDDFLGSVVTDGDGRFSFSVNNDDGWLQNGRDLYVKLKLRNSRWRVHDGGDYEWKSPQFDDLSEGAVVDIGTMTPEDDMEAVQIFAFMDRAWQHATSVGGRDPGHVEIDYPGGGDFFNGTINLSASTNRAPDIAIHEYGHFLMASAYPGGDPSPGGAHGFDGDQDARLSWSEGWATGFMLSVCNDGQYNWDEGTSEGAGEWPACTTQNDAGGRQIERYSGAERLGERQEGRVAGIILDLIDSANDDNGGSENRGRNGLSDDNSGNRVSLATIYNDVMVGSGHNNLLEFWTSLAGELSGARWTSANRIFRYNWASISAPIEISCVASKVAAAELKDYPRAIDGLRAFRDTALKPYVEGRDLMRLYYRNSPELAEILIRSPQARKHAAVVVGYFSTLGEAARDRKSFDAMFAKDGPVVPKSVAASINALFEETARSGSPELRADAAKARKQYDRIAAMPLSQVLAAAEDAARADDQQSILPVRQQDLSPRSAKADWTLIRKNLPPEAGYALPADGPADIRRDIEKLPERKVDPRQILKPKDEQ